MASDAAMTDTQRYLAERLRDPEFYEAWRRRQLANEADAEERGRQRGWAQAREALQQICADYQMAVGGGMVDVNLIGPSELLTRFAAAEGASDGE